jgi:hypothetical protein
MSISLYVPGTAPFDRARIMAAFGVLSESSAMSIDPSLEFTSPSFLSIEQCEQQFLYMLPRWYEFPRFAVLIMSTPVAW